MTRASRSQKLPANIAAKIDRIPARLNESSAAAERYVKPAVPDARRELLVPVKPGPDEEERQWQENQRSVRRASVLVIYKRPLGGQESYWF